MLFEISCMKYQWSGHFDILRKTALKLKVVWVMNIVRVLENAGFLGFLGISRQKNYTNKIKKGLKIVFLQLLQFHRFHSKLIFFVCKTTLSFRLKSVSMCWFWPKMSLAHLAKELQQNSRPYYHPSQRNITLPIIWRTICTWHHFIIYFPLRLKGLL